MSLENSLSLRCIIKITYIAVTPTCFYPSCCIVTYIPIMDISADKVYNTNQTDAPKKILMGMQIEDLLSSTFLYYYSLTSDLEIINLNSPLQVVVHDTEQQTNLYSVQVISSTNEPHMNTIAVYSIQLSGEKTVPVY